MCISTGPTITKDIDNEELNLGNILHKQKNLLYTLEKFYACKL